MSDDYSDIIGLPHPDPKHHTRMPLGNRAAQFMPYAALSAHAPAIRETARRTEEERELDAEIESRLSERLRFLAEHSEIRDEITVTWFRPDDLKEGGAYLTESGRIRKIKDFEQLMILESGAEIPFGRIVSLEGKCFDVITDEYI